METILKRWLQGKSWHRESEVTLCVCKKSPDGDQAAHCQTAWDNKDKSKFQPGTPLQEGCVELLQLQRSNPFLDFYLFL